MFGYQRIPFKYRRLARLAFAEFQELEKLEKIVEVYFPPFTIFVIISAMQVALKHPDYQDDAAKLAKEIGTQLQEIFPPSSAIYHLIESGWDSDNKSENEKPPSREDDIERLLSVSGKAVVDEMNEIAPDSQYRLIIDADNEEN